MRRELMYGIVGILLGFVLALALGATMGIPGRYQIAGTADTLYIIDTATSQVWSRYQIGAYDLGTIQAPVSSREPVQKATRR